MADPRKRLPINVPGGFFVDSTCIDCDACRQLAPDTFAESGDTSYVYRQPVSAEQRRRAFHALITCPTASIGASSTAETRDAVRDFPLPIEDGVFFCGFNSEKSFGGNSYFVRHPGGNWLIDSPRYVEHLARRFQDAGGVANIFLTHRDDVADAAKWAARFHSRRIIHRLELSAQPAAEMVIDGTEPVRVAPDFLVIPTPGHTRGHCALLYRDRFLFTGDHLWWSRNLERLNASRNVCWHSWPQQTTSMARLSGFTFEWVLPGHGERAHLSSAEMRSQIERLAQLMQAA
jgi:glyoxylase-like metal-dependent hydrolase (beta-lactamase superfamily II)/ferredoxin